MFGTSTKKKKEKILKNYFKIKEEPFYFYFIRKYFSNCKHADAFQVISDKTYQDLDLDEVFMFADRTASKVGQQYLYSLIRTIPNGNSRRDRFEKIIRFYNKNAPLKESIILQLSRLNNSEAFYIYS